MKNALMKCAAFVLTAMISATAWAAEEPLGALTIKGQATITAGDSSFTLKDQEYAYFANDRIQVDEGGLVFLSTTDGLKVTFVESSVATVSKQKDAYNIDLQQGAMVMDSREDVGYRLNHNDQLVSVEQRFKASDEPYIASVVTEGDVRFYMPAQLDAGGGFLAGLTQAQIAALIAAGVLSAGYVINQASDNGPSS